MSVPGVVRKGLTLSYTFSFSLQRNTCTQQDKRNDKSGRQMSQRENKGRDLGFEPKLKLKSLLRNARHKVLYTCLNRTQIYL